MKRLALLTSALLLNAATSFAGYTITRQDGGANTLVQGREYGYVVTSNPPRFENIFLEDDGGPLADYQIIVGPGVQKGPNEYKPDASGQLAFIIRFHRAPGNVLITARNSQDPNDFRTLSIGLQRYPQSFQITPPSPTVDANVPFNVQIIAMDGPNGTGSWVSAFEDAIQIRDLQLSQITPVAGAAFIGGQATVPVTIKAGDMNNQTRLQLTLVGTPYFDGTSFVPAATYTSNLINVRPGAFSQLVMLFPGETLRPGIGKDSVNIATQTADTNVSAVDIWRVDQFFNPILNSVPTVVSFTSSDPNDTPPANRNMNVPPLRILGTAADPFIFRSNGNRTVKATPDGNDTRADTSVVPVNPGAANAYVFTTQPPAGPITVDDVITVRITAYNSLGNVLTTLNGPLTGSRLSARALGETRMDWVDTNHVTEVPDNTVNFAAGVATINLIVTKRATGVRLRFEDQFNTAVESNQFDVNRGAPAKIHFTIVGKAGANPLVGQIYTPGTYPGNSGSAPIVKAGESLIVEARVTDRRWNLYSDFTINNTEIQLTGELPNNFIEATHPDDPTVRFDSSGELKYIPGFDSSFRVKFRTAGVAQRIRGVSTIGAGQFFSSTVTVIPEVYSRMIVAAPGEILRPGTDVQADGKDGVPTQQQAGVNFDLTIYAVDQYFNPVASGPYPEVNFTISPAAPNSIFSNPLPSQLVSSQRTFSVKLESGSDITVRDTAIPSRNQMVSVPIGHGPLDHFTLTMANPLSQKAAGEAFQVTIQARDEFDNVVANFNQLVNLQATTGVDTMSPTNVTLVNGTLTLDLRVFTASDSVRINMIRNTVTSPSAAFRVVTSPLGFQKLLLLLPGETAAPGVTTVPGKTGTATPITVGLVTIVKAIACDPYYNPLNTTGTVEFASNRYSQFGGAQGSLSNVEGHGEYATTMILRTAAAHTISVREINVPSVATSSSSISGLVGAYKKIQVLAPGEVGDPGTLVPTGKTAAAPLTQKVGTPFTMTMNAVDDFWNIVPFNGGDLRLNSNTTSILFNPLNNVDVIGDTPRPFTNGVATRDVIIGTATRVQVSALDEHNLTKPGQTVEIQVNPGPTYTMTTPASAVAGQPFSITVRLEENGVAVNGYNESIFLTASSPLGGSASGNFNADGSPREYVMTNGVATINDLTFAYSEHIQIRLADNFGRVAFSNDINVVPSGLKYRVNVPTSAVAGPPSSFNVSVELLDENTNTLVKNHDHEVAVEIISAVNPSADGQYTVTSANLAQGVVTFQQSYSKAESIIVRISESATGGEPTYVVPAKTSNNILVLADGYKKILLVAPGEVHVPGVPSATGKNTANPPFTRQLGVPFLLQVRAVDQYWNVANNFNGSQIHFQSDDDPRSINASNPSNQDGPFVNGESASSITLYTPGDVTVSVSDIINPSIGAQSVRFTVGGNFYQITTPVQEHTGPPTVFTMNVTLIDFNTGLPVTAANNPITIQAFNPDGTPAAGTLGVTSGNLSNGTVGIANQSYTIAENIFIRVADGNNNLGNSAIIRFIPRQVRYTFDVPSTAEVNVPFAVTIRTIDQDTGTDVRTLSRTNALSAFSTLTGLAVTGNFIPNSVNIVNGVGTVNAVYDRAEPIFIMMNDNTPPTNPSPPTQANFSSGGSINVRPGALTTLTLADFTLQSNETRTFRLLALDTFGNPIPTQRIRMEVVSAGHPGPIVINGQANSLITQTGLTGEVDVTFDPTDRADGEYELLLSDPDRVNGYSRLVKITVLGFPFMPSRALELGGNRIPLNSNVKLDIGEIDTNGGTLRTFYRVDRGAWFPYNETTGILSADLNRGYPVFNETREYQVEWYSEICYDLACANPVSQRDINGAPNFAVFLTYEIAGKLAGYPSPFNPKGPAGTNFITLQYPLAALSSVEIDIYDLFGQKVWHKDISAGQTGAEARPDNQVIWMGTNDDGVTVANGGYIVTVKADGQTMKSKILVVK